MNRLPKFKQASLKVDGWFNLHGPTVKAGSTRVAAPIFNRIVHEFLDPAREDHRACVSATRCLAELYAIIYSEPMFMSDHALERLKKHVLEFGRSYQKCRDFARRDNVFAWNVTPKIHRTQHIPLFSEVVNLRFLQCYNEESQIGTTTK
eukprot:5997244-Pyramimonas_sp.AAC.1